MLYFPLIWAFLSRDLGFGYVGCSALMHALPALAAFVVTGSLGNLFDRTNPWTSWACVRFVWGRGCDLAGGNSALLDILPARADRFTRNRPSIARQRAGRVVDPLVANWSDLLRSARRRYEPLYGHHGFSQWGDSLQRVGSRHGAGCDGRLAADSPNHRRNWGHLFRPLLAPPGSLGKKAAPCGDVC